MGVEKGSDSISTPSPALPLQGGGDILANGLFRLKQALQRLWRGIRRLSGDDAYERYLAHCAACHKDASRLSRREFFLRREQQKWGGIKRCC